VGFLLSRGLDIAARDSDGESALHQAAKGGQKEVVRVFLDSGADVMAEDTHGRTALHKAATSGNRAVVSLLLEKRATISAGIDGRTVLHFAGNEEITSALLSKGADANARAQSVLSEEDFFENNFSAGRTPPWHWAAYEGSDDYFRLLVKHGAEVDALNVTLRTPPQEAIFWGHVVVVKALLELGASVHEKDNEGWRSL